MKPVSHTCEGCTRLETRVADLEARLARIGAAFVGKTDESTFSSRRGCGPVGISDERWKRIAKEIGRRPPGSRWYIVEHAVYEKWLAEQSTPASDPSSRPWHPSDGLQQQRLRLANGGARS